jgi:hypothetical protein
MEKKRVQGDCDSCIHHQYDEEMLAYYCDLLLDEDEMMRFSFSPRATCPFYQFADEYINVRKQI